MKNPYAGFSEGHEALEVLKDTLTRVRAAGAILLPAQANTPWAPGKWTVGQVLVHLAQCEMMFGTRYRQALTIENYQVQTFDQDSWLKWELNLDAQLALDAFIALRSMNVGLLEKLTPEELDTEFNHPELGKGRIREMMQVSAGHDLNHLEQLEGLASAAR